MTNFDDNPELQRRVAVAVQLLLSARGVGDGNTIPMKSTHVYAVLYMLVENGLPSYCIDPHSPVWKHLSAG